MNDKVNVRKLKYYYIRESGEHKCTPVAKELQTNMTKVIKHFESIAETKPTEIKLQGTEQATKLWRYWMTQEPASFGNLLGNGKRLNPFVELAKKLTFSSDFTLGAIYSLIDDVLPKENADKMKEVTRKCDEELTVFVLLFLSKFWCNCARAHSKLTNLCCFQNILGDDGVLIYHNMTRTAPFHYALLLNVTDFSYWSIFNVLHVPATQVCIAKATQVFRLFFG